MGEHVLSRVEGKLGVIRLQRPAAINALTPDMIGAIRSALTGWARDDRVVMVLFEGEGPRGFCAGGDVRWTRNVMDRGEHERGFGFFVSEYGMNRQIATYEKPVVALTHGAVMGGGIGIAGHARYRIGVAGARYAMPEAAIGFFCDVGVRAILAHAPRHRALMFMLSGVPVGLEDAMALGLVDGVVPEAERAGLRERLVRISQQDGVRGQLEALLGDIVPQGGMRDGAFCALADRFAQVFAGDDGAAIMKRLEREVTADSELGEMAATILGRCPTSHQVHVLGLDAARHDPDVSRVLSADLELSRFMAPRHDFSEGVRAVLVDKDHSARWQPDRVEQVDVAAIRAALERGGSQSAL